MRRHKNARAVLAVVLVAVVAGCTRGPTQEEIVTANDDARAEIQRLAAEGVDILLASNADLNLDEIVGELPEQWSSCGDEPYGVDNPPETILWTYERVFRAPDGTDTPARVGAVSTALVDEGWVRRLDSVSEFQRIDRLGNADGYVLEVNGHVGNGQTTSETLSITVMSPCVPAPPDLGL